jgi:hypothetical protein
MMNASSACPKRKELVARVLSEFRVGYQVRKGQRIQLKFRVYALSGHNPTLERPEIVRFDKSIEAD